MRYYIVGNKAKGRISKRVFHENKASQIFRKTNISYPLIRTHTCTYQGVRNVFGKFGFICFLEAPVLRFALWPYYQRHVHEPLFFSLPLMLLYSFHFYISVLSHHMFCALFYEVAWLSSSCFLIPCIMIKL